jgi:6-pyruvoyltetrahydropterin/6-carboxytetrahydropterin synthase|tara:strand:+ start:886 stop:1935 length:1050 start_codon:yes stop_codon:yes gene_type:complete
VKDKIYLCSQKEFNAARQLEVLPTSHPFNNLHGHTFRAGLRLQLEDSNSFSLENLKENLSDIIDPINYSFLNDGFKNTSDISLAGQLFKKYNHNSLSDAYISSTLTQGACFSRSENPLIWKKFSFQAAHKLPNVSQGHKCGNMHGHTFEVIVSAKSSNNTQQELIELDRICNLLYQELNKKCLNDMEGLENPTSEIISSWIFSKIKESYNFISKVEVMETTHAGCSFDGKDYKIWRDQKLESAVSYESEESVYGFGYTARLYVESPIDEVFGWVMDFGDIKEVFKPVFLQMDHHYLNELDNLDNPSVVGLVEWMGSQLRQLFPQLSRVGLYESKGNGAELFINKEKNER